MAAPLGPSASTLAARAADRVTTDDGAAGAAEPTATASAAARCSDFLATASRACVAW
jgi:hypothetical protein